jgi:hypothetical protein
LNVHDSQIFKPTTEEDENGFSNKNSRVRRRQVVKNEEFNFGEPSYKPSHPDSKKSSQGNISPHVDPFAKYDNLDQLDLTSKGKKLFGENNDVPGVVKDKEETKIASKVGGNKENGFNASGLKLDLGGNPTKLDGQFDTDIPTSETRSRRMRMGDNGAAKVKKQEENTNKVNESILKVIM